MLTPQHFKPGARFKYKAGPHWQTITIHPNCAKELIAYVVREFRKSPKDFRRVGEKVKQPII